MKYTRCPPQGVCLHGVCLHGVCLHGVIYTVLSTRCCLHGVVYTVLDSDPWAHRMIRPTEKLQVDDKNSTFEANFTVIQADYLPKICVMTLAICLLLCGGCRRDDEEAIEVASGVVGKTTQQTGDDHFSLAIDFVTNLQRYEQSSAVPQILYHLHRWTESRTADDDWVADPMFARFPSRIEISRDQTTLSCLRFRPNDVLEIREAMWARDLGNQIAEHEVLDDSLREWLLSQQEDLGRDEIRELDFVIKAFDWLVRNMQLDPATSLGDPQSLPIFSWEALMLGHGDYLDRARNLILIARQRAIPVVMLGIDRDDAEPEPWLPAALIGGQLYLFDTRLGLPLPDSAGEGVATLAELVENPGLLRECDTKEFTYPIQADDLRNVVAMIDATPGYLSQRMKLVESALSGENKLTLTAQPSPLATRLRNVKGITRVIIWPYPYDTLQARNRLSANSPLIRPLLQQLQMFQGGTPLALGRRQQFRGIYADDLSETGAKSYYLSCRIPDQVIAKIGASGSVRKQLGMPEELPEDPNLRRQIIEAATSNLERAKRDASYWLGLIAMDAQQWQVAANHLEKRVLEADPNGPWTQGATYNLARTSAAMGQDERAIELYRQIPDSPQAHGNELRARRLAGKD